MKHKIIFIILFSLLVIIAIGVSNSYSVKISQEITLLERVNKFNQLIIIKLETSKPIDIEFAPDDGWWGASPSHPTKIITKLKLLVENKSVYVPLSVYNNLSNPYELCIETSNDRFLLTILGGSASTSYKAEIEFNNFNVIRKKITHLEFPNEVWEETFYSFQKFNNIQ